MKKELTPFVEILLAATIWGSAGVFIRYISMPPEILGFFRLAIPTIILFFYFQFQKIKIFTKKIGTVFIISILNAVRTILYLIAFGLTSIGNAVILLYTWPIFASIFGVIILKEKLDKKKLSLILLAFLGVVIAFSNREFSFNDTNFVGMSMMIASGLLYALTVIIFKKEENHFSNIEMVFYQNALASLIFIPFVISYPSFEIEKIELAVVYSVVIGLIPFLLFFSALKKIAASSATSLTYIEIVSAIIFGFIFFQEIISLNVLIGGGLIIGSALLMKNNIKKLN